MPAAAGVVYWPITRVWPGETAFIVAGGPSVKLQNLEPLKGRKVIVINSSCYRVPWGSFLFFMDARWWRLNRDGVAAFQGQIVTSSDQVRGANILHVRKRLPDRGFAADPSELMHRRTSLSAALNMAAHLRPRRVVLLGADGQFSKDGDRNHHAPHRWAHVPTTWADQRAELARTVEPLRALGIDVVNASPHSALPFWPKVRLEDCL